MIPIIGFLCRWAALARFSPVLSSLIEGHVPLDEALILAGDASGDAAIQDDCRKLAARVRSGETLEVAGQMGQFPQSFLRALSAERHREGFTEILRSMADMYASRARALVALLVALLPGLMVLFVGFTVGLVVVSLYMPLYDLLKKLSI
jgi:type IV pilus assembly protein PilC